ncbi:hypothetical protein SAMN05428642_102630 [Flaviramulus basaltis]|uniref:Uncharacterized protein n=1 Tax=Flaviramulus basaltis TaxID=369401 RepID=A0A1K2IJ09_9FLAO|nr:hypothetical protein [Flaviramulus basaltis]SFZ92278.1 hypothetical protein SAMN05428642_102630 [Flaviramulus basaltis]
MKTIPDFKSFNRDKTMEELEYNTKKWKNQIDFLQIDFVFLKSLIDSDIYNSGIINLFETLQLYKTEIQNVIIDCKEVLNKLISHEEHIKIYLECDDIDCDYFFIETHVKIEYNVELLVKKSNNLKTQIFEYIKSVIIK